MPNSPRLALPYFTGSDPPAGMDQQKALVDKLDPNTAVDYQGTLAARPAPGTPGRYYFATDNGVLYRDTGTAWTTVSTRDRVIWGMVLGTGAPFLGAGFTPSRTGVGNYRIDFTVPFASRPVGVAMAQQGGGVFVVSSTDAAPGYYLFSIQNAAAQAADIHFGFVVVGPGT
ncbi:MAG TPA: hypothetical protein VKB57_27595 [Acidimicrobiales bacterium]|nr:hypothetical protein [Acidimicrobiales bacterium]